MHRPSHIRSYILLGLLFVSCQLIYGQVFDYAGDTSPQGKNINREQYQSIDDAFIGGSVGVALPLGQFKSKDYENYYSGYADNGYYFSLLNGYQKFGRFFGVGLNWNRSQYDFNEERYLDFFNEFLPTLDFDCTTETDWVIHSFTGNLVINVPGEFIDVDVRVGGGVGRVSRPLITVQGYERATGFLSYQWDQAQSVKTDLMLGFGMNGRLHLTPSVDFLLQWDYQRMSTTMTIEHLYALSFRDTEEFDQFFEILTVGAGLGVRID